MNESILTSIKAKLGQPEDYEFYDPEIIMDINSVLGIIASQYGIGKVGFKIEDSGATWDEFLDGREDVELVKSFVAMKVRLMFDNPNSGPAINSMTKILDEFEWRMVVAHDTEREDT